MKRFSNSYRSFRAWKNAMPRNTEYARRIIQRHKLNPAASLRQLRSGKGIVKTVSHVAWDLLTSSQRVEYKHSLEALRLVRRRKLPLSKAAKQVNLSQRTILEYVGKALRKVGGRFVAKRSDGLYRRMKILERGRVRLITVTNSRDASRIGQYFSAVGRFRSKDDLHALEPFADDEIIDAEGDVRRFETDPEQVLLILSRIENLEFFEIYETEW